MKDEALARRQGNLLGLQAAGPQLRQAVRRKQRWVLGFAVCCSSHASAAILFGEQL